MPETGSLTGDDLRILAKFRSGAERVRNRSVIDRGESVQLRGSRDEKGHMQINTRLLDDEAFDSLLLAFRPLYADGEEHTFLSVCNRLRKRGSDVISGAASLLRQQYLETLNKQHPLMAAIIGNPASNPYSPRQIVDTWINHDRFHHDDRARGEEYQVLSEAFGENFETAVQMIVLQIAGRIIDLDDLVADALGEDRVDRIGDSSQTEEDA